MVAKTSYIPYGHQSIDESDIAAVVDILKSEWLTQGPVVAEFEEAVARRTGAKYAVAVSSGTAALHCACFAAGVGSGDEIITAPITFAASGNCARYLGADVQFVDVHPDSYCLDPARLEAAINGRTRAIIPVDFTGRPCDIDAINAIAARHGITVIEDAAHSFGATYKSQTVGALADMTIFSFHPVKLITTGEGGMIVTNDDELAVKLRMFRSHGTTKGEFTPLAEPEQGADNDNQYRNGPRRGSKARWYYEMQLLGFNYRISDFQCALGLNQLGKMDHFLERRRLIAERYNKAFNGHALIRTPQATGNWESAWHLYVVNLNLKHMVRTRRQVFEELRERNIGVHVHYIPLHLHPYYRETYGYKRGDFPVSEAYYDTALTLPLYPGLNDAEFERVVDGVLSSVR